MLADKNHSIANVTHEAIKDFNLDDTANAKCLLLVQSGTLNMQGCSLSVESIKRSKKPIQLKTPCIY